MPMAPLGASLGGCGAWQEPKSSATSRARGVKGKQTAGLWQHGLGIATPGPPHAGRFVPTPQTGPLPPCPQAVSPQPWGT